MAHDWQHVQQGIEGIGNYGIRHCSRCGAMQLKDADHLWMRVTGYRWEPLVGRCIMDRKVQPTKEERARNEINLLHRAIDVLPHGVAREQALARVQLLDEGEKEARDSGAACVE
jgi:hypothetical protein